MAWGSADLTPTLRPLRSELALGASVHCRVPSQTLGHIITSGSVNQAVGDVPLLNPVSSSKRASNARFHTQLLTSGQGTHRARFESVQLERHRSSSLP